MNPDVRGAVIVARLLLVVVAFTRSGDPAWLWAALVVAIGPALRAIAAAQAEAWAEERAARQRRHPSNPGWRP